MIGIRHEDRSRWEARVPLIPSDVRALIQEHSLAFRVQESPVRVFPAEAYQAAGARVVDDLADCSIVMGVKEIPPDQLERERTYVFFSHVIKGQPGNMPTLRRLLELHCQLIDYERIVDARGQRLVSFGRFAGLAGLIDTLWALGQRWKHEGFDTPFAAVRPAHQYDDVEHAKREIAKAAEGIRRDGLPIPCQPLVCGFAGYGQVSQGAQEVYDLLPVEEVPPGDLASVQTSGIACFKTVFYEKDMVERIDSASPFDLQEYYDHPERYRGRFADYLPHLAVLVTAVYWETKYPHLVTRDAVRELYGGSQRPRLRVIGDLSCDVEGSVECTIRITDSGNPVYVYEPATGRTHDGVVGDGPVILAVDNLPCELPADASAHFSRLLSPFIPSLARADFRAPLAKSGLPPELVAATIVYHGELTEPYRHLEQYLTV